MLKKTDGKLLSGNHAAMIFLFVYVNTLECCLKHREGKLKVTHLHVLITSLEILVVIWCCRQMLLCNSGCFPTKNPY